MSTWDLQGYATALLEFLGQVNGHRLKTRWKVESQIIEVVSLDSSRKKRSLLSHLRIQRGDCHWRLSCASTLSQKNQGISMYQIDSALASCGGPFSNYCLSRKHNSEYDTHRLDSKPSRLPMGGLGWRPLGAAMISACRTVRPNSASGLLGNIHRHTTVTTKHKLPFAPF